MRTLSVWKTGLPNFHLIKYSEAYENTASALAPIFSQRHYCWKPASSFIP